MPNAHTSQSGPVTVTRRFTPITISPELQKLRLSHKLALIEGRIADRENYVTRQQRSGKSTSTNQLERLLKERQTLIDLLASFTE